MGVPHIPNRSGRQPQEWSRRGVISLLGAAGAAALAGCTGSADASGTGSTGSGDATTAESAAQRPEITVIPADGTTAASFVSPVEVAVRNGGAALTSVRVAGGDGSTLAGSFGADRTTWTSDGNPLSGTEYTVTAVADDGTESVAVFTTTRPGETFLGYFTPEDGSTSGVGMPVSLNFTHAVTDRAAVQRAITVSAEPPVEIVGHWFSDTRLDFRPETYWASGTTITLGLRLRDVAGADGVYGTQAKDVTFHIGREQISTVDLAAREMTVRRDGETFATYPVTGGDPDHLTWSGIMVISERSKETRMESSTVGLGDEYDIPDVPHAQRLTTSGTFVHGNYWAASSVFGSENTSHGCVSLDDTRGADDTRADGYRFYDSSMLGDVVIVENSGEVTVDPANGLNGWNLSWADWRAGSAL
ncbi:Ig-like domain-containing protein [Streptomyces sp. NPDC093252]|uniref:L,D-transpeptidase n=1 Tax=Streptomyces sp. NPDC093252 TaxID=3154980 RepID=UPI00341C28B6